MALYLIAFLGGTPIGAPVIGAVMGVFGPRWGLVGGGLVCVVATVLLAAFVRRSRKVVKDVAIETAIAADDLIVREPTDGAA